MGFTSLSFLVFFPIILVVHLLLPPKGRRIWLLAASYLFGLSFGTPVVLVLFFSTLVTYLGALFLERCEAKKKKQLVLGTAVFCHVLFLSFFKYNSLSILLPIGISFYTFQAIGYLADVYRGNAQAEHNFISFALFQAFFPKLVQGPIERSDNLLVQIRELEHKNLWDVTRIREGALLLLWGLFQKLMIADRIAVPVNAVYSQFGAFGGVEILLTTVLYAFQIYCDFAGYTCIARGTAQICGLDLLENFKRPYLADSVQDFWRRWHLSLSSWLRDYVYIPLGGNRKGKLRKYTNILITFLVSGIWHGTGLHFLLWGGLHGLGQMVDSKSRKLPRLLKQILVFLFVDAAWMVFRVNSLGDLKGMLQILVTDFRLKDFAAMQLGKLEWALLFAGILLVVGKDLLNEKGFSFRKWIQERHFLIRCLLYTGMVVGIITFGVYGAAYDTSQFLYTQF